MWCYQIQEAGIIFSTLDNQFLHEKGQSRDDSTCVIGVMEVRLFGVFHGCIDYDPPPGEKLHRSQAPTCRSGVSGITKQDFLLVQWLWNARLIDRSICEQYQNSSSHGCDGVPSLPPVHAALAVSASDPVQKSWHDCGESARRWNYRQSFGSTKHCDDAATLVLSYPNALASTWRPDQNYQLSLPTLIPRVFSTLVPTIYAISQVSEVFSRRTEECRRTLLFIALELANISLKVSVCDEGESVESRQRQL